MSWVANLMKKRPSFPAKKSGHLISNVEDIPNSPIPLRSEFERKKNPVVKTSEVYEFESQLIKMIKSKPEDMNVLVRSSLKAFDDAFRKEETRIEFPKEIFIDLEGFLEYVYNLAEFLAPLFNDLVEFAMREVKRGGEKEDLIFLKESIEILHFITNQYSTSVTTITHTKLPKPLVKFKIIFNKLKYMGEAIMKPEEEPDLLEAWEHLDKAIFEFLSRLLAENVFVKELVIKDDAFALFNSFIEFPSESITELVNITSKDTKTRNTGLIKYLSSKKFITLCCIELKKLVLDKNKEALYQPKVMWILQLMNILIEESNNENSILEKEFNNAGGYDLLSSIMVKPPFEGKYMEVKNMIIGMLENFIFIGKDRSSEDILSLANLEAPEIEIKSPLNGPILRNIHSLTPLIYALLFPKVNAQRFGLENIALEEIDKNITTPTEYRERLLMILNNLAKMNYTNYLLINKYNVILELIETFHLLSFSMKSMVMNLLSHSVRRFGHIPLKELSVLPICIQESKLEVETHLLIHDTLVLIIGYQTKIQDIAREVGLLKLFEDHLELVLEQVKLAINDQISQEENNLLNLSIEEAKNRRNENKHLNKIEFNLLMYPVISQTLLALLDNNEMNLNHFKQRFSESFFELLNFKLTRYTSLELFNTLIKFYCRTNTDSVDMEMERMEKGQRCFELINERLQIKNNNLEMKLDILSNLISVIKDNNAAQFCFTRAGGFVCLFSCLLMVKDLNYEEEDGIELNPLKLNLIKLVLSVFLSTLADNQYAQWYIINQVGLNLFEEGFELTGILENEATTSFGFGILIGLIMGDPTLFHHFENKPSLDEIPSHTLESTNGLFGTIRIPCLIPSILYFAPKLYTLPELEHLVLKALWSILSSSIRNQIHFSQKPILIKFLRWNDHILSRPSNATNAESLQLISSIIQSLFEFGSNDVKVENLLASLLNNAKPELNFENLDTLEVLLNEISGGVRPPVLHFDSNPEKPSYLSLDSFQRSLGSGNGYTVLLWLQIMQFPESSNVSLIKVYDENNKLTYELSINESRYLSLRGSNGLPLLFNTTQLRAEMWYHIALVQSKGLLSMTTSNIKLYINGKLSENHKHSFGFGSEMMNSGYTLILGEKNDSTETFSEAVWNLASLNILDETIESHAIETMFGLGVDYSSTFQDTHKLNLVYSELEHSINSLKLNAVMNLDNKSPDLPSPLPVSNPNLALSEDKILVSINPSNLTDFIRSDRFGDDPSLILASPITSRFGLFNLKYKYMSQAYESVDGFGYLSKDLLFSPDINFSQEIWKLGGCSLLLKLIDGCSDTSSLEKAISITAHIICQSNLFFEEMARVGGYEILGYLIKKKAHLASPNIIRSLLSLAASRDGFFNQYIITNPIAFHFLFLDFDIWRPSSGEVQEAILDVLKSLVIQNSNAKSNLHLMGQLDSVKRLVFLLRFEQFQSHLLSKVIEILKALLLADFTQENVRLLVGFITSVLSKEFYIRPASPRNIVFNGKEVIDEVEIIEDARKTPLKYHLQLIGNSVLEMLHDILRDDNYCIAITHMITSKWILLLFNNESNPYAIVLTTRILSRLIFVNGSSFMQKFKVQHEGFAILNRVLVKWWFLPQLYQALLSIIFSLNINDISLTSSFDFFTLMSMINKEIKLNKELVIDPAFILFTSIKNALTFCLQKKNPNCSTSKVRRPQTAMGISFPKLGDTAQPMKLSNSSNESSSLAALQARIEKVSKMVQTLMQFITETYHSSKAFRSLVGHKIIVDVVGEVMYQFSKRFSEGLKDSVDWFDYSLPPSIMRQPPSELPSSKPANDDLEVAVVRVISKPTTRHRRANTMPESDLSITESEIMVKIEAVETFIEFVMVMTGTSVLDPASKHLFEVETLLKVAAYGDMENYLVYANYLLSNIIRHLKNNVQLTPFLLSDNKSLVGISKLSQLCVDFCYQGLFSSGRTLIFDFIVAVLDKHQQQPVQSNDANVKSFNTTMLMLLDKSILYCFKEAISKKSDVRFAVQFLKSFMVQHKLIFDPKNNDLSFWRALCYNLFIMLKFKSRNIQINTFNVWKFLVLMKKDEIHLIFKANEPYAQAILNGFLDVLEMDLESFASWIESDLDHFEPVFDVVVKTPYIETDQKEKILIEEAIIAFKERLEARHKQFRSDKESELRHYQIALSTLMSWSKNLQELENDCYARLVHDKADSNSLIVTNWKKLTSCSSYFKENSRAGIRWKLDFTEGPYRMRRRLKPNRHEFKLPESNKHKSKVKKFSISTSTSTSNLNSNSINNIVTNNKASKSLETLKIKGYEDLNNFGDPTHIENELDNESKVHRVLRYLDPNDEIIEIYNIGRVAGLDVVDALLVFCRAKIYVIDGYFLCKDGNIVESFEIPEDERDVYLQLLTAAANYGNSKLKPKKRNYDHLCRKCSYSDLKEIHKRKFLFRESAIEIFFGDGRNLLITTILNQRDIIYHKFTYKLAIPRYPHESVTGTQAEFEPTSLLSSKLSHMFFGSSSLNELCQRWCNREITNFEYLTHLNTFAGRSFNDLTQYPVFPWVLSDYSSEELDLTNPGVFRELSKPMGAQSDARAREFELRYKAFEEGDDSTPPFHYGTHYSSAMIVCWYLIRLEPFTSHHLKIQGGNFDHPNRLFFSIKEAWLSAAFHNTTDVRELIPEFYYLPEFLKNWNQFDFGCRQDTSEPINHVQLPPWAKGDPELFILKHREALESDYVSERLHNWIDLIFGYQQIGEEAVKALNVFHHLSYEDAVDLDRIEDPIEKAATIGIIHNFGQTPRQLFKAPHPKRNLKVNKYRFDFRLHPDLLIQSYQPILEVGSPVRGIIQANGKLMALGGSRTFLPRQGQKHVEWGLTDNSLRLFQTEPKRLLGVYEQCHLGPIQCAEPFDDTTLITGGEDGLVKVWTLHPTRTYPELILKCIFRGAAHPIKTIVACKSFGIIAVATSGSNILIYDLPRLKYLRTIQCEQSPHTLAIDRASGNIVACSERSILVWNINGQPKAHLKLASNEPKLTSILYVEPRGGEFFTKDLIITGHQKGTVNLWFLEAKGNTNSHAQGGSNLSIEVDQLNWKLSHVSQLQPNPKHVQSYHPLNDIVHIAISTSRQALYTGTRQGLVYAWQFPDTPSELHRVPLVPTNNICCGCEIELQASEKKFHCQPCGGIVCAKCVVESPFTTDKQNFLCPQCNKKLESGHFKLS